MSEIGIVAQAFLGLAMVGLSAYGIAIYNGLIRLRNNADKAWSNIDVLLKQRHDEVPNLVAVCKGYMKHEHDTLEAVARARHLAAGADSVSRRAAAEGGLAEALVGLYARVEDYPDLKADRHFLALQKRISEIEEQIADRRELYNESANRINIRVQQFPDVLVARPFGFTRRELYQAENAERREPVVDFSAIRSSR
ncbi:MAG: LemA family protein [Deltaproteobacteria bacterium]|nr:LemA family protein [Deltaproteobacteria bacterium]